MSALLKLRRRRFSGNLNPMQLEELKQAMQVISEEDRHALSAYLRHLDNLASPEHAQALADANRRIDEGHSYTLEDLERAHAALEAQGR